VLPSLLCPLLIKDAAAASVTLAWDPNEEPDVTGYKIYYGKTSGTYESVIDAGNQTTYTIPGFLEGVDYYFTVTAYNAYGLESDFSDEVTYPEPSSPTISLSTG
jgi:fibronectin type 3 domain-containing protein